jgi:hypothetical protein
MLLFQGLRRALPRPKEGGDSEREEALAKPRKPVGARASSSSELISTILRFWPAKDEEVGDSMAGLTGANAMKYVRKSQPFQFN